MMAEPLSVAGGDAGAVAGAAPRRYNAAASEITPTKGGDKPRMSSDFECRIIISDSNDY